MRANWGRGLFRAWAVFAVLWIFYSGWTEFNGWKPYDWVAWPGNECWDRFAKWPDGRPFDVWDMYDEFDIPSNVELNKKNNEWAADSTPERNQWRNTVRRKAKDCAAGLPINERAVAEMRAIQPSLAFVLGPPVAILIAGCLFGWVAKGFRVTA